MRERPILFSGAMVRALLDGSKTQTRRIVKQKHLPWIENSVLNFLDGKWNQRPLPYGQPGDRLWVRETCRAEELERGEDGVRYIADGVWLPIENSREAADQWIELNAYRGKEGATVPAIHMPRWASRITLEIGNVRVERLREMEGQAPYPGDSDAIAEGINRIHHGDGDYYFSAFRDEPHPKNWCDPTDAFRELWEQINGPDSWEANPWVWVIEFRRIEQDRRAA